MDQISSVSLLKLTRTRVIFFSSFMTIGFAIYLLTNWLLKRNKCNNDQQCRQIKRVISKHANDNAMEDLIMSINQIDGILAELPSSDILKNSEINLDSLELKIKHLKILLGTCGQDEHTWDRGTTDKCLREGTIETNANKHLNVVNSDTFTRLQNHDESYDDSLCSDDSFVSASEFAELAKAEPEAAVEEKKESGISDYNHLELYSKGAVEYSRVGIPVRKLRTEMLRCKNDGDFKIKVYCIRKAFELLFEEEHWRLWFTQLGRRTLVEFLIMAGKDHATFEKEFDSMISYCQDKANWHHIEKELKGRKVSAMTFYDIVLDFIIMDSFQDLENPPSALLAVIQNGWISNSIKETALSAAVWSLLKTKSRLLQNPDAFLSRMYQVSQHLTPVLVYGFLGPAGSLKRTCMSFKNNMLGFLLDVFSVDCANYSTARKLADDIVIIAKRRNDNN